MSNKAISFRKPASKFNKIKKLSIFVILLSLVIIGADSNKYGKVWRSKSVQMVASALNPEVVKIGHERTIWMMDNVAMPMAKEIVNQILDLNAIDSQKPILMVIESPGGDIMAGRKILSAIKTSKAPVYAQVIGICASMAAIIAMHCDKIYATSGSWFLFHNASLSFGGMDIREAEHWLRFYKEYMDEMNRSTAEKMGITFEEYKRRISNTWLMTAEEALRKGFIDGYIAEIACKKGQDGCIKKLYEDKPNLFRF